MQTADTGATTSMVDETMPLGVDDLTFRLVDADLLSPERDAELIELLRTAFNGGPSWFQFDVEPLDHVRWKLHEFAGRALLELIEDGDRMVGCQIRHLHRYLSQGEEVAVTEGVDLAHAPAYQGRGLRSATRALRDQEMELLPAARYGLGLGAHPLSQRRLGRTSRNELVGNPWLTMVKVISPAGVIRARLAARSERTSDSAAASSSGNTPSRTRAALEAQGVGNRPSRWRQLRAGLALIGATAWSPFRRPTRGAWTIQTVEAFDDRADRFWERAHRQFDVVQIRDRAYLNWRFCDRRSGGFTVRTAEQDGELLGYVALRVVDSSEVIADLLTLPDRPDVVRALIDDAVQVAQGRGADRIRCWSIAGHQYLPALRRAGFSSYPHVMSLTYRAWSETKEQLAFLADPATRIHFQPADTDHL